MNKLILVVVMFLFSCNNTDKVVTPSAEASVFVYFTTIDSCEYVVASKYYSDGGVSIVHKENCYYCTQRNSKPCK